MKTQFSLALYPDLSPEYIMNDFEICLDFELD